MKTILTFLANIILLIGCIEKGNNREILFENDEINKKGILIIFDKQGEIEKMPTPGGLVNINHPQVIYIDDNGIEQRFLTKKTNIMDTFFIESNRAMISIAHSYFQMDQLNYIFNNGDTVVFSYNNATPIATIKNRNTVDKQVNYEYNKRKNFGQLNSLQGQFYYDLKTLYSHTLEENREFAESSISIFKKENDYLDSLFNLGQVDLYEYSFHKNRIRFEMYSCSISHSYGYLFSNYYESNFIEKHLNDSTLAYHWFFINEVSKYIYQKYHINQLEFSNASFPNYKQAFDSVSANIGYFNLTVGKLILNRLALRVVNDFSVEDSNEIIKRLSETEESKNFANELKEQYLFSSNRDSLKNQNGSLELLSIDNENITFEQIVEEHKGKVIYIDFWASWCSPCLSAMPYSNILRNDYGNKNIVFIYLSIDRNIVGWQKAIVKAKLDDVAENYILLNHQKANLTKQIKLSEIPRYLILDKQGNLVHHNAPGPDSKEIRELLEKYLAERN